MPVRCLGAFLPGLYLILRLFLDYELGRLLVCSGDVEGGKTQLDLVYSGKPLEINAAGRKSKYSLEVRLFSSPVSRRLLMVPALQNALHMRCHAALEGLKTNRL